MPVASFVQPSYAWEDAGEWVKFHVRIEGIGSDESKVQFTAQPKSFILESTCLPTSYRLGVTALFSPIDPSASSVLIKPDRLTVKLKKVDTSETWKTVNDASKILDAEHRKLAQSGASTQELLANMMKHASDEDRAALLQSAAVGAEKRAQSVAAAHASR